MLMAQRQIEKALILRLILVSLIENVEPKPGGFGGSPAPELSPSCVAHMHRELERSDSHAANYKPGKG